MNQLVGIRRRLALVVYYGFAKHFPTQPVPGYRVGYFLRRWLLQFIIDECGQSVIVKQGCYFGNGTSLKIGSRSQLGQNSRIDQRVTIGEDVVMEPDVVIMTNAHAFRALDKPINKQGNLPICSVSVGDDVWIGTRVIILPGVSVGDQAVIGANSVVTRDMPPRSIVAGSPARIIGYRGFSDTSPVGIS